MILLTLLALAGVLLLVMEILISGFGLFGFSGSIALILSLTLTTVKYGFTALFALLVISLLFAFFLIHFLKSKKEKLILQDVLKAKDFDNLLNLPILLCVFNLSLRLIELIFLSLYSYYITFNL